MYQPGIAKVTKRSLFSMKDQQNLIDGVNSSHSITGGDDFDVRFGPTGRTLLQRPIKPKGVPVVAKVVGTTVTAIAGGSVTLQTGWYVGRFQTPKNIGYKPRNPFVFSDYWQDASGTDDVYICNYADSGGSTGQLTAGEFVSGYFSWSLDDDTIPYRAVVVIPAAGGGAVESKGQYQYQSHQMVAQDVDGWDFTRFHNMIP